MLKRVLSFLLVVCLCASMFSVAAFASEPLPQVTVNEITPPAENVPLFAFNESGNLQPTGKTVAQLGAEYTFTPVESAQEAAASPYADWRCDYVVTFDQAIEAGTFGLYGKYGDYDIAFVYPNDIEAGESVYLLEAAQLGQWTYKDIVGTVQEFTCGAFNLSDDNTEFKNMTVELVIWDPNAQDQPTALADEEYDFGDKTEIVNPALPTVTVTEVAPTDENVPLYKFDERGELQPTGKTVAKLGAEYTFTPDETAEQAAESFYADWRCDYVVTFDQAIEAGTFGLYGKYGDYDIAFVYPNDIEAGESVYLLEAAQLGQWTYKDIVGTVQEFTCGAFNLSDDNTEFKNMTVELVIWDPNAQDQPTALADEEYDFGDKTEIVNPALPTVTVTEVAPTDENVPLYAFNESGNLQPTGKTVAKLGAEYTFTPDETAEQAAESFYADWRCDYVVTFDQAIEAGTFGLYGKYGDYDIAFVYPNDIEAGESVYLLEAAQLGQWTYKDIVGTVQEFTCGAFNLSDDNTEFKNMTVELVIWDPNAQDQPTALADEEYDFGDKTEIVNPALPTVTVTEVAPTDENVPLYKFDERGELQPTGKTVAKLGAEYTFTPDETAEQAAESFYADWRCDYVVTFDQAIEAGTFGLYGKYGDYDIAFVYPNDIEAGESVYLLEAAQLGQWTYKDIVGTVQEFTCGAFNLSDDNTEFKNMTVELVIWDPNTQDEPASLAEEEYDFADKTDIMVTIAASAKDENGGEVAATVSGGGDYAVGTEVTLTANNADGYSFVGWYLDDDLVSPDQVYTFAASDNAEYTAVYAPAGDGKLTVTASSFTIAFDGGQVVSASGTQNYDKPVGSSVELSYSGDDFLYWVNSSNNIVSREAVYSFTLVNATELHAVSSGDVQEDLTAFVVFHNAYNQIVKEARVDAYEVEEIFPEVNPSKMGSEFTGWVIEDTGEAVSADNCDAIIDKMSASTNVIINIIPEYTSVGGTYNVYVMLDDSRQSTLIYTEEIAVGESFVISKSDISKWSSDYTAEEIGYFMYGDSKCYGNQCTVISGKANVSIVVTAVVDPSAEPVVSLGITQMFASMNGDKFRVSPTMKYYVPDNCTVIESGFVYSYATSDPDKLVLDNVGNDSVKKHISGSTESSLIYTMNIGTSYSNRVFNVVAFLTYRDAFGDIQTIYTDVYSGSYNSLS